MMNPSEIVKLLYDNSKIVPTNYNPKETILEYRNEYMTMFIEVYYQEIAVIIYSSLNPQVEVIHLENVSNLDFSKAIEKFEGWE